MHELLPTPLTGANPGSPGEILVRLVAALAAGVAVAWIHKRTSRGEAEPALESTLVLLAVLIAMITQVIGDNVARAFSLVGALSIVRFRTALRDTRDTAFVIFAVVEGMAIGSMHPWVALVGLVVAGGAAFALARANSEPPPEYALRVKADTGADIMGLLAACRAARGASIRLLEFGADKKGIDASYREPVP